MLYVQLLGRFFRVLKSFLKKTPQLNLNFITRGYVYKGTYYSTERNGTERLFRKIPILRNEQLRC